jgi:hypothetical protein
MSEKSFCAEAGENGRKESQKVGRKSRRAVDALYKLRGSAPDLSRPWCVSSAKIPNQLGNSNPLSNEVLVSAQSSTMSRSKTAQIRRGHAQFVWLIHWRAEIFALPFLCFLRFFAAIPLRLTALASSVIEGSSGKTNFAPC